MLYTIGQYEAVERARGAGFVNVVAPLGAGLSIQSRHTTPIFRCETGVPVLPERAVEQVRGNFKQQ